MDLSLESLCPVGFSVHAAQLGQRCIPGATDLVNGCPAPMQCHSWGNKDPFVCHLSNIPDGSACGSAGFAVCSTTARLSCILPTANATRGVCGFLDVGRGPCGDAAACHSWLRCNPTTRKCQAGQLGEACPQGATASRRECQVPLVCRAGEERVVLGRPGTCQHPYCHSTSNCPQDKMTCALEDGTVAGVGVRGQCYPVRTPAANLRVGKWAACTPFSCAPELMCEIHESGLPALLPKSVGFCQEAGGLALGKLCTHAQQGAHSPRGERGLGSMCKGGLLCRKREADPTSPFGECRKP
jgi:hypothetical protein